MKKHDSFRKKKRLKKRQQVETKQKMKTTRCKNSVKLPQTYTCIKKKRKKEKTKEKKLKDDRLILGNRNHTHI